MNFKRILIPFILIVLIFPVYSELRLNDIFIDPLNDIEVENSTGTIVFYFSAEKATLLSAEKKANTENKQWRLSNTTGESGYYLIEPILKLNIEQIEILEGDKNGKDFKYVNKYESDMKLINAPKNYIMNSLLLLDVSGSITKTVEKGKKPVLEDLKKASIEYVKKLSLSENNYFSVYVFDGREEIIPIIDFSNNKEEVLKKINEIDYSITKDFSTNLYGAVYNSIDLIKSKLSESKQSISIGALTIFTDGTDRAGRLGKDGFYKLLNKIDEIKRKSNFYIYTIGLGREIDRRILMDIGYDGAEFPLSSSYITSSFEKIAKIIDDISKSYYRVEYKTPSRKGAGVKTIIIQMKYQNHQGGYRTKFDADNFTF